MSSFGGSTDPAALTSTDFVFLSAICNKHVSWINLFLKIIIKMFSFISPILSSYHLNSGVKLYDRVRDKMNIEGSIPPTGYRTFWWAHHHTS